MKFGSTEKGPCPHPILSVTINGRTASCTCGWHRTYGMSSIVDALMMIILSTQAELREIKKHLPQ